MAVSEDTKAIISQLEKNAEMVRSSNEDTSREVHVRLDKFADAFVSISANIRAQNQMLQTADKSADERLERERADRDFADLKRDTDFKKEGKENLQYVGSALKSVGEGVIGGIGKAFEGGLLGTVGRILKVGLGAFVGYNFMKGFLGPKYDGMFENIESVLKQFALTDLPATMKKMAENVSRIALNFEENMNEMMDMFDWISEALVGIAAIFGINKVRKVFKGRRGPGDTKYRNNVKSARQLRIDEADRQLLMQDTNKPAIDADADVNKNTVDVGDMNQNQPEVDTTKGLKPLGTNAKLNSSSARVFGSYGDRNFMGNSAVNRQIYDSSINPDGSGNNGSGRNVVNGPGKGPPGTYLTQDQMDLVLKQMNQEKWFKRFVKGAGAVGFIWGAYEMEKLYKIWIKAPPGQAGDEIRKRLIIDGFGATLGGMLGGAIGGLIGFFGGPWGILIGSIIGGVAGSMAGALVAGYIYDWACGKKITEKKSLEMLNEEIAKAEQQLNDLSRPGIGETDVFAGAYADGLTLRINHLTKARNSASAAHARRQSLRVQTSAQNNQRSMEMAAYGRGGRAMYEVSTHGTPEQKGILLDALIETYRGNKEFFETIEDFIGTSHTTVVNAPNNSSTIMAPVGGAVTKNDVNVLNTGSTGASAGIPGLPYIMN